MKNKIWIPIIALLLITSVDGFGQRWKLRRYEIDGYLGMVSFHGDIGLANKPLANTFNGIRPGFGLIPRFMIRENLAVSLDLGYLMYGGKDEEGSSHGRYYSFTSHAFQHVARVEYYIIGPAAAPITGAVYNRRGMVNNYNKIYVYVYGGAGGVLSKSKVKDLNTGEEPVNNPGYNNNMVYSGVFPVGAGVKWSIDPRWSFGFEMGYTWCTSDLLDGYASAEHSNYRDSYYLTSVKAIYKIRNDKQGRPIFKKLYR